MGRFPRAALAVSPVLHGCLGPVHGCAIPGVGQPKRYWDLGCHLCRCSRFQHTKQQSKLALNSARRSACSSRSSSRSAFDGVLDLRFPYTPPTCSASGKHVERYAAAVSRTWSELMPPTCARLHSWCQMLRLSMWGILSHSMSWTQLQHSPCLIHPQPSPISPGPSPLAACAPQP